MGNCLTPCVDGSTLEHLHPEKSTLEHPPLENSILEHPSPENSTLEHPPSENSTLEHPPPENSTPDTAAASLDKFDVHGEDDLKRLLDYIDQTLQARQSSTTKNESSTTKNEASETITSYTNIAADLLERVTTRCNSVVNSDITQEAYQILISTLGTVGNLHWITAGLSIVALILNRMDTTGANFKQGLSQLQTLRNLGRHVVNLYPQLPRDDDALRRATSFIAEGAITCCTHLQSGRLKRFAFANENNSSFAELKKRVPEIHQDLSLACDVELQRRNAAPLAPIIAEYPINAVGLDDKVSKVLEMLGILEGGGKLKSGVRAVDLHGIGGIGKSTLGSAVHAKLPFQGRSHVRVEVAENPLDEKICKLQTQILERILNQKVKIGDCKEGRQKLKQDLKKFCKDPCMFFIDNIFHPRDLDKLLPDELNDILPDGSRIIITSRPHHESISEVLSRKGVDCNKYDVPELDYAHAQTFLCKEIFSSTTFPADKLDKAERILKLCGGLPLALQVVGGYLSHYKDDDATWDAAIEDLGNCLPLDGTDSKEYDLTQTLEFGYKKLRPELKIVFLDVACLLRGIPWDLVKPWKKELETLEKWGLVKKSSTPWDLSNSRTLEKWGLVKKYLRPWNLVKSQKRELENLKKQGPVRKSLPPKEDTGAVVDVHDLLVALAQRKQREEIQHRSSKEAAQYPELIPRIFVERSTELPFPLRDEDDESLCMHLEGVNIKNSPARIPAEKLNAMQKLRVLILSGVKVQGNYTNISKHLHICIYVNREKRTDDSPFVIGQLPTCCEMLHLKSLHSIGFVPQAFPEKSSLRVVSIVECDNFQELPEDFLHLTLLKELDLTSCRSLRRLPANFERLRALESLILRECYHLVELPRGFGGLAALLQLDLQGCTSLTKLPNDFGKLGVLESLDLNRCEGLIELPRGFGRLTTLRQLDLRGCKLLTKLSDDFGNLGALESLDLSTCEGLIELPKGFERLIALKSLKLHGCKGLLELPEGFGGLAALGQLNLQECTGLTKLPHDFGSLGALDFLNLHGCVGLLELPHGFGRLAALQRLDLQGCTSLTKLPEDFGNLGALQSLVLRTCVSLRELPKGFGRLVALLQLDLSLCFSLATLPDDFGSLGALKSIDLTKCQRLIELPKGFGGLAALRQLNLLGCTSLTKLPADFGNLGALESLDLSNCEGLIELPKGFERLTALTSLKLHGCEDRLELPKGFEDLGI